MTHQRQHLDQLLASHVLGLLETLGRSRDLEAFRPNIRECYRPPSPEYGPSRYSDSSLKHFDPTAFSHQPLSPGYYGETSPSPRLDYPHLVGRVREAAGPQAGLRGSFLGGELYDQPQWGDLPPRPPSTSRVPLGPSSDRQLQLQRYDDFARPNVRLSYPAAGPNISSTRPQPHSCAEPVMPLRNRITSPFPAAPSSRGVQRPLQSPPSSFEATTSSGSPSRHDSSYILNTQTGISQPVPATGTLTTAYSKVPAQRRLTKTPSIHLRIHGAGHGSGKVERAEAMGWTRDRVLHVFQRWGDIRDVYLRNGYFFVHYVNLDAANRALNDVNIGTDETQGLRANWAHPEKRPNAPRHGYSSPLSSSPPAPVSSLSRGHGFNHRRYNKLSHPSPTRDKANGKGGHYHPYKVRRPPQQRRNSDSQQQRRNSYSTKQGGSGPQHYSSPSMSKSQVLYDSTSRKEEAQWGRSSVTPERSRSSSRSLSRSRSRSRTLSRSRFMRRNSRSTSRGRGSTRSELSDTSNANVVIEDVNLSRVGTPKEPWDGAGEVLAIRSEPYGGRPVEFVTGIA